MFIFIEVEIFKREFFGKVVLSRAIIDDGIKVIISTRQKIQSLINSNNVNNSILITKDVNPRKDLLEYYKLLKSKNFLIISQDEERGYIQDEYEEFHDGRHGNGEVLKIIDFFLCWGNRDFNFLKKNDDSKESRLETAETHACAFPSHPQLNNGLATPDPTPQHPRQWQHQHS